MKKYMPQKAKFLNLQSSPDTDKVETMKRKKDGHGRIACTLLSQCSACLQRRFLTACLPCPCDCAGAVHPLFPPLPFSPFALRTQFITRLSWDWPSQSGLGRTLVDPTGALIFVPASGTLVRWNKPIGKFFHRQVFEKILFAGAFILFQHTITTYFKSTILDSQAFKSVHFVGFYAKTGCLCPIKWSYLKYSSTLIDSYCFLYWTLL